jgi:hypothetical protein
VTEINGAEVQPLITQGAWVCQDCRPDAATASPKLSRQVIGDAVLSMSLPIRKLQPQASPDQHFELLEYLEQHLAYYVPGLDRNELSSLRFLKSLRSLEENSTDHPARP